MVNKRKEPLIGAIRWDAWFPGNTYPGFVERSLYTDYSFREPFYGWYNFDVPNAAQIMDDEINYAADAGLDFWAFVWYPANDPHPGIQRMSGCLDLYMKSTKHQRLGFALILQTGWVAGAHIGDWRTRFVPEFVSSMLDSKYIRVEGNRPLLFWMDTADLGSDDRGFGNEWAAELQYLSDEAVKAGLGAPFIVDMRHDVSSAKKFGLDGVSDYGPASISLKGHHPYGALAKHDRAKLEANHGLKKVPGIGAVIDPRPRHNDEWTKAVGASYYGYSFEIPTYREWYGHLVNTVQWVKTHPKETTDPGVIVIYAWNEIDEGGPGIVPTRQEGTMFLDAISAVKTGQHPHTEINRVNDSNPNIRYGGKWEREFPVHGCYCNDRTVTDQEGALFEFDFVGTSIGIIGGKPPQCGNIDIYLDGKHLQNVDLVDTHSSASQLLFETRNLENKEHTLKVVVSRGKSGGQKQLFALDALHYS